MKALCAPFDPAKARQAKLNTSPCGKEKKQKVLKVYKVEQSSLCVLCGKEKSRTKQDFL